MLNRPLERPDYAFCLDFFRRYCTGKVVLKLQLCYSFVEQYKTMLFYVCYKKQHVSYKKRCKKRHNSSNSNKKFQILQNTKFCSFFREKIGFTNFKMIVIRKSKH